MNISMDNPALPIKTPETPRQVEKPNNSGDALANEMKDIRKAKLQRQVMSDPSLAGKLVATEASPQYNASGALIQAVSSSLGDV